MGTRMAVAMVLAFGLVCVSTLALAAAQEPQHVKADVTGRVLVKAPPAAKAGATSKTEPAKEVVILVVKATGTDGKDLAGMAGKSLKVIGTKVADVEKLANKEVVAKGILKEENKALDVESVCEAPVKK